MIAGGNTVAGSPANVPADNSALSLSPEDFKQALSEDRLRIVFLVGQSQVGKSTLTCHLVGKDVASIGNGVDRCTDKPQQFALRYKDKIILFVDTPGFNDAETTDAEQMEKISTKLLSYDLVSTVLLCVNVKQANISASLVAVVKHMKKAFGDDFDKLLMMHMTKYTMVNPNGFSDDSVKGPVYEERATAVKACEELEKSCEVVVSQGLTYSDADPYRVPFDAVSNPPEVIQKMKPAQQKALKFRAELLEKLASATMYPTLAKRERDMARQILDEERKKLESAKEKRMWEESMTINSIAQIMKEADNGGALAFLKQYEPPMYVKSSSEGICCFERLGEKGNYNGYGSGNRYDNIDIRAVEGAKLKLPDKRSKPWIDAIRNTVDSNECYIDSYEISTAKSKQVTWWENRRLTIIVKPKTPLSDQPKQASETALNQVGQELLLHSEPTKALESVPREHQVNPISAPFEAKTSRNPKSVQVTQKKPSVQWGSAILADANNLFANAKKMMTNNSEFALQGRMYRQGLADGTLRIVFLVGQSQVGKSTLTCHLLGKDLAAIGDGSKRCTVDPQQFVLRHKDDKNILLVDTPGWNNKDTSDEANMEKIIHTLSMFDSVSTVMLCVNAKSAIIDRSMVQVLEHLRKAFGEDLGKMLMLHMTKHTMVNGDELSDDDRRGEIYRDQVVAKTMLDTLAEKYQFVAQQGLTFSGADPDLVAFDEINSPPEKVQMMIPSQQKALAFRAQLIEKLASSTMYPTLAKKQRDAARRSLEEKIKKLRTANKKRVLEEQMTNANIDQIMKEVDEGGRLAFFKEYDKRPMYVLYSREDMCGFERRVKQMEAVLSFGTHFLRDNIDFRTAPGVKLELLDKEDAEVPRLYLHWSDTIRKPIDFKKYYIDSYDFTITTDTRGFIWWDHRRLIINVTPLTPIADHEMEVASVPQKQDDPAPPIEVENDCVDPDDDKDVEKAMEIVQQVLASVENDRNLTADAKAEAAAKALEALANDGGNKNIERIILAMLGMDPNEHKNTKEEAESASSESTETPGA